MMCKNIFNRPNWVLYNYLYKADFSLAALHNVVLGHSLLLVGLQQHESGKTEAAQILAYTNEYDELIGAVDM